MQCNKDDKCLTIYKIYYPEWQKSIGGYVASANNVLTNILDPLGGLVIPNDYLGEKVKSQIQDLCRNFKNDSINLGNEGKIISNKINDFISIHQNHYRTWYENHKDELIEQQNGQQNGQQNSQPSE